MANEFLRDLLIVNRRFFDEAVATVRAQANHDIDRALRDASLWAYREASRRPKSELQQINKEAQRRAERNVAEIQSVAAEKINILKALLHEREKSIRTYCDQREDENKDSQPGVAQANQCLTSIRAPVPPQLAETFGYTGHARFVAFYHEPVGDEVMYDDGRTAATGDWYAFKRWCEHPAVAIHVQDVNLGYSDLEPTHWLIIDRELNVAYAAHVSDAQVFLQDQHTPQPAPSPYEIEHARSMIQQFIDNRLRNVRLAIDPAEIHRRIQRQESAVAEMLAFLDLFTDANPDSPPESV